MIRFKNIVIHYFAYLKVNSDRFLFFKFKKSTQVVFIIRNLNLLTDICSIEQVLLLFN